MNLSHEHILRIRKLVLTEDVVFRGGSPEPEITFGRFGIETTGGVDAEAAEFGVLDVVVCNPEPDIFEVETL